jgi:hypothetical protein
MSSVQNIKPRLLVSSDFKGKSKSTILIIAGLVRVLIQLSPVYSYKCPLIIHCIRYERLIYIRIFLVVSSPQFFLQ